MMPLFTVITVTLNPGERLRRTVESIAKQRFPGFEHVIKDGGTSDGSLVGLPRLASPHYVVSQRDAGVYDAMNQGARIAKGKYIIFLNAGDEFHDPDVLARLAPIVRACNRPVVYGDYFAKVHGLVMRAPKKLTRFFLFRSTLCHQSWLVDRIAFQEAGGFDTKFQIRADADLLVRLCLRRRNAALYCPGPISIYEGGGLCETSEGAALARAEAQLIRQRYFTRIERLCYGALRAATFPETRARLTHSRRFPGLGDTIRRTVNAIYDVRT